MNGSDPTTGTVPRIRELSRQLEFLRNSPRGLVIQDQIARLIRECEAELFHVESLYLSLLHTLLSACAQRPSGDALLDICARLIQIRAQKPGVSETMVQTLRDVLSRELGLSFKSSARWQDVQHEAMQLLRALGAPVSPRPPVDPVMPRPPGDGPPLDPYPHRREDDWTRRYDDAAAPVAAPGDDGAIAAGSDDRSAVESGADRAFSDRLRGLGNTPEFHALVEAERDVLARGGAPTDIEHLRHAIIGGIDELIRGQHTLASKLRRSSDFLKTFKDDRERLTDELTRARQLSMTDEATTLPNRRAFLQRLDDELGRAQRYETPLSVAIVDLDSFKLVNDTHGHAAGDEVLRVYARSVFSVFRHHDLVARLGGEEFAVLLSNTGVSGALRSLRKMQSRVRKTTYAYHGRQLPLPTFSAGLVMYAMGESASVLMDRADKALYRAKDAGRDCIETSLLPGQKAEPLDEEESVSVGADADEGEGKGSEGKPGKGKPRGRGPDPANDGP